MLATWHWHGLGVTHCSENVTPCHVTVENKDSLLSEIVQVEHIAVVLEDRLKSYNPF